MKFVQRKITPFHQLSHMRIKYLYRTQTITYGNIHLSHVSFKFPFHQCWASNSGPFPCLKCATITHTNTHLGPKWHKWVRFMSKSLSIFKSNINGRPQVQSKSIFMKQISWKRGLVLPRLSRCECCIFVGVFSLWKNFEKWFQKCWLIWIMLLKDPIFPPETRNSSQCIKCKVKVH